MQNKTTLLIYNPRAGKNRTRPQPEQLLKALGPLAASTHLAVTAYPGHAREIASVEGNRYQAVICCGGDGTLNEVISGLPQAGPRPAIGYIPIGSTNDLASNVGIPADVQSAAELIRSGLTHGYDVGAFNERFFTYIASFGPGVSVSYSTPQRVKNVLGYSAYMINGFGFQVIPTMRALKPRHIRVEYDGNVLDEDFYFGTVSNALSAGGMFRFNKDEVKFDDGLFEVVLIRRVRSPLQLFSLLGKMRRHEYDGGTLVHFQAASMRFVFDKPEIWTLDGESSGEVTDVRIDVKNEAVRLFSPNGVHFVRGEKQESYEPFTSNEYLTM